MIIRPEEDIDHASVRRLHLAAFETPAEADLVENLRRDGSAVVSLVAVEILGSSPRRPPEHVAPQARDHRERFWERIFSGRNDRFRWSGRPSRAIAKP